MKERIVLFKSNISLISFDSSFYTSNQEKRIQNYTRKLKNFAVNYFIKWSETKNQILSKFIYSFIFEKFIYLQI